MRRTAGTSTAQRIEALTAHPGNTVRQTPGYAPHLDEENDQEVRRDPRTGIQPNTRPHWSGPMPGQTVMGVDRLEEGQSGSQFGVRQSHLPRVAYEVDQHGFVHEDVGTPGHDKRGSALPRGARAARNLYGSHGGIYGKRLTDELAEEGATPSDLGYTSEDVREHDRKARTVKAHWNRQPLVQMPTSSIIHTGQSPYNTEGDDVGDHLEGRVKIDQIRRDLEEGGQIHKPAWVAKVNGRHFALDGHHRIVAAREAGQETFPARVWDLDAEAAARTRPGPDVLPEHIRQQMRSAVDAGRLHPRRIATKWRSQVMR